MLPRYKPKFNVFAESLRGEILSVEFNKLKQIICLYHLTVMKKLGSGKDTICAVA